MLTNLAIGVSIAGILVALFAVIILFLTRKNILDILQKDVILFDKNFELKKQAIEKSFILADASLKPDNRDREFTERAMACYNELLCVISDVKIASYFHFITIDNNSTTPTQVAQYKIACRHDLGLEAKGAKLSMTTPKPSKPVQPKEKPVKPKAEPQPVVEEMSVPDTEPVVEPVAQPTPRPQMTQPAQPVQPQQVQAQRVPPQMVRPTQPQYPQGMPQQARPVQPAPRPQMAQPTQPQVQPQQTQTAPAARRGRPPKSE